MFIGAMFPTFKFFPFQNKSKQSILYIAISQCFHSIFHFIYFITFSLLMCPPDNKGIKLTAKIVNEDAARYKRWISRKEPGGGGYLGKFLLGMCRWPVRAPTPL